MNRVAIVDYGMCNLDSVARAIELCGANPMITDEPCALEDADRIILPGVGAFPDAMRNLRERGLDIALGEHAIRRAKPFLGICLGMQLLATKGWEVEETDGLGYVPGEVRRLRPTIDDPRIPHVGWNEVNPVRECQLLCGVPPGRDFYFVHSYAFLPAVEADVAAMTPFAGGFVSMIQRGTIFGVQFHPEKSQRVGFMVLRNFLEV